MTVDTFFNSVSARIQKCKSCLWRKTKKYKKCINCKWNNNQRDNYRPAKEEQ